MSQKKAKIGRPKPPEGEDKGRIVPVRFRVDQLKAMDAAAKRNNQSVSEWIRAASQTVLNNSADLLQQTRVLINQSNASVGRRPIAKRNPN